MIGRSRYKSRYLIIDDTYYYHQRLQQMRRKLPKEQIELKYNVILEKVSGIHFTIKDRIHQIRMKKADIDDGDEMLSAENENT